MSDSLLTGDASYWLEIYFPFIAVKQESRWA